MPDVETEIETDEPDLRATHVVSMDAAPRLRRLFVQFAVSGLVAVLVVGLATTIVLRRVGTRESVRDARRLTEVIGRSVIEPNLADGLLRGDQEQLAAFDRIIRTHVLQAPVVRVKLWTPEGRVVYSDEARLIGHRYDLEEDERAALARGRVDAGISDLSRPENRFERSQRKLLEVYMPVKTERGQSLLFEAYLRFSAVAASGRHVWLMFAPALGAALVMLWLAQLPLALSLARRLWRDHGMRETLLLRALNASDVERRRIAADLHDGVVQDLAGTSYALAVGAGRAEQAPRTELAKLLRHAATSTQHTMRQLRSLLVEIYPPNLRDAGLAAALDDLAAGLRVRGVGTEVSVDDAIDVPPAAERLVFRTAQEALRNIVDHAAATTCTVTVGAREGGVELAVHDDGRGFDSDVLQTRRAEGHVGLGLLADAAADAGGELTVESTPGHGTRLRLWIPSG